MKLKDIWVFDIEADDLLDNVTTIHCIVFIRADYGKEYTFRADSDNPKRTIEVGIKFLKKILESESKYLAGHNIASYDLGVFYKLYGLDILSYYKKVIDTLLIAQLIYPKFRLEDSPLSKYLQSFEKQNHSLDAWSKRAGLNKKLDYNGAKEGTFINTSKLSSKEIKELNLYLKNKEGLTKAIRTEKGNATPILKSDTINNIKTKFNIQVRKATTIELSKAKWYVVDYDSMIYYCKGDVKANIDVLKLLMRQSYYPSKKISQLESYVAMYGALQTTLGHRIDVDKMKNIKLKNELLIKKIDMKLSGCFTPYYKDITPIALAKQNKGMIKVFENSGLTDIGKWLSNTDAVLATLVISKISQKINYLKWRIGFPCTYMLSYKKDYLFRNFFSLKLNLSEEEALNLLKPYKVRKSSIWLPVTCNSPRAILKELVSPVSYTKAGKPKTKKMLNFKYEEEELTYYRKVVIDNYGFATKLELVDFKPNSRQSIIKFLKLKYDIVPDTLTDSESYKLDANWFSSLDIQESKLLSDRFKYSKIISECNTILNNVDSKNRVRHTLNSNATNTSRMCVPLNTLIKTPKGLLNHETIKVGDLAYTLTNDGLNQVLTKVTAINVYKDQPVGILTNGDIEFECTEEHKWVTQRGLVAAKDILPTDRIILGKLENVKELK